MGLVRAFRACSNAGRARGLATGCTYVFETIGTEELIAHMVLTKCDHASRGHFHFKVGSDVYACPNRITPPYNLQDSRPHRALSLIHIFKWKVEGLSPAQIADQLNTANVPSPIEYKKSKGSKPVSYTHLDVYKRQLVYSVLNYHRIRSIRSELINRYLPFEDVYKRQAWSM